MIVPANNSTTSQQQLSMAESVKHNRPIFLDFDNGKDRESILSQSVPLHKHALQGNWPAAKRMLDENRELMYASIAGGWPTVLHVAAGTNHVHFVEELLKLMDEYHGNLTLPDMKGNTAFCFAATAGNMQIVQLMLQRNPSLPMLRGATGFTPLQFAALQGRCQVATLLYEHTRRDPEFEDVDWNRLFFTCITTGIYELALRMVRERPQLAFGRDENNETGLHLLAAQESLDSCCKGTQQSVVLELVKFLWNTILRDRDSKLENILALIREPSHILFDAAEVGNSGFVSEVISDYPNLIWETNSRSQSIIHIAVLNRHASIYNLVHEIGAERDIIVTYVDDTDGNTLLHLAAKLAPPGQLELVSGAAFQMSLEILWFEEVKKIMPASLRKLRNSEGLTARELFTKEHQELRKNGESWMKSTAESCMLISTVIATGVFTAADQLPGGNDDSGTPNFLKKTAFTIFAISDATALISSSTSILIFLSILVSRYAEYDFHKSLPVKLIFGLIALFISITSMMVAFGSTFFITYYHGNNWVPSFISIFACLPIFLFIYLQFSLWSDIIYSTYYCRNLFKPTTGKRMLRH